jgi:hypothetical protein
MNGPGERMLKVSFRMEYRPLLSERCQQSSAFRLSPAKAVYTPLASCDRVGASIPHGDDVVIVFRLTGFPAVPLVA